MALVHRKSRTQESRDANKRPEGWKPPNAMPELANQDPEFAYRWIRKFINGAEEDKTNFFKRLQRGWRPVSVEQMPEMEYLKDADGNIQFAGCILCKIDAKTVQADVRFYEDQAIGGLASAKNEYEAGGSHEYVPKFSESGKTRVIRGRLPNV